MMLRNLAVLGLVVLASTCVDADGHEQACQAAKANLAKHCSAAGEAGEAGEAGGDHGHQDDGPKPDPPGCTDKCAAPPKSCEDAKKMIAEGGCAHSCSDKFKAAAQKFVKCPGRRRRDGHGGKDHGHGGKDHDHGGKDHGQSGPGCEEMAKQAKLVCDVVVAEAAVKAQVIVMTQAAAAYEAAAKAGTCSADAQGPEQDPPGCADTCKDAPKTCEDAKKMTAKGGCAHSCSDNFKAAAQKFAKCPGRRRRDGHGGKDHGHGEASGEAGESDEDGQASLKAMCGLRMRRDGHAKAGACARRLRKDGHAAAKSCDCLKQELCDAYAKVESLTAAFKAKAAEAEDQQDDGFPKADPPGCTDKCPATPKSCNEVETMTTEGGCAHSCSDKFKAQVKELLECTSEDDGFPKADPPGCTDKCPATPKSCKEVKTMTAEGGCAHSCTKAFQAQVKELLKCPKVSASANALAAFDKACPATTAAAANETTAAPGRSRRDGHAAKLCPAKARRDGHAKDACAGSRMRKDGHAKAKKSCDCLKQEFCAARTAAAADAPPATTTAATTAATTKPAAKAPGATTTTVEESSAFQMASSVAATFAAVGAAMAF